MRFEDILNQKLPSKMYEGASCDDPDKDESCVKNEGLDLDDDIDDDIEDDLDDIDLDDADADELDDIDEDDLVAVDDDDEEELDDDEEVEADKTMAIAATPILLDKELNESTYESFLDEFPSIVSEGFLLESDLDMYLENPDDDDVFEEKAFASKTKVQFSEKDRKKQLFEIGVQASARAHNDPVYWKLQKVYKLERQYKAILRKKYRGEALRRVKTYIKRLKSSSSKVLSGIANKLTGK